VTTAGQISALEAGPSLPLQWRGWGVHFGSGTESVGLISDHSKQIAILGIPHGAGKAVKQLYLKQMQSNEKAVEWKHFKKKWQLKSRQIKRFDAGAVSGGETSAPPAARPAGR
jgi:hypothetical protein